MSNDNDNNSVLSSLSDISDVGSGSGGTAKVKNSARLKGKVKKQSWMSDDSAGSLLAGILDETGAEAEAEQSRRDAKRTEREEAARRQKEDAEHQKQLAGSQALAAERARKEQLAHERAEMEARLERERMIEQGLIIPEEEARAKAEAEAKHINEEANKREKDAALVQAQDLINEQQRALKSLTEARLTPVQPEVIEIRQKANTGLIVAFLAVILLVGAAGVFFLSQTPTEAEGMVLQGGAVRSVHTRTTNGSMAGVGYFTREGERQAQSDLAGSGSKATSKTSKKPKKRPTRKRPKPHPIDLGGESGFERGGPIIY